MNGGARERDIVSDLLDTYRADVGLAAADLAAAPLSFSAVRKRPPALGVTGAVAAILLLMVLIVRAPLENPSAGAAGASSLATAAPSLAIATAIPTDQGGKASAQIPPSLGPAPSGGLTRAAAIGAAMAAVQPGSSAPTTVVSATAGPYSVVGPGGADVRGDRWVWAIELRGSFAASGCATSCSTSESTTLVIVDYVSGEMLLQEIQA